MKSRGAAITPARATKVASHALDQGLTISEAKGPVKAYLAYLYQWNRVKDMLKHPKIRLYGDYVYIFNGCRLITSYKIPGHIYADAREQLDRKRDNDRASCKKLQEWK